MKKILFVLFLFLIGCTAQEPAAEVKQKIVEKVVEEVKEEVPEIIEEQVAEIVEESIEEVVEEQEFIPPKIVVTSKPKCPNPERYEYVEGYCVEDACQDKAVKCMVEGNRILRPECECWIYLGDAICSIKAAEETRVKSPLCTRKGQVGAICGAYDSNKKHCVNF